MRSFSDQILLLQFQPTFYEQYLNDYSTFKNYKYKIGKFESLIREAAGMEDLWSNFSFFIVFNNIKKNVNYLP